MMKALKKGPIFSRKKKVISSTENTLNELQEHTYMSPKEIQYWVANPQHNLRHYSMNQSDSALDKRHFCIPKECNSATQQKAFNLKNVSVIRKKFPGKVLQYKMAQGRTFSFPMPIIRDFAKIHLKKIKWDKLRLGIRPEIFNGSIPKGSKFENINSFQ